MDSWRNRSSASVLAFQNRPEPEPHFPVMEQMNSDDEHPADVRPPGVRLVVPSLKNVGSDVVGHNTTEHANSYQIQRRRRFYRGGLNPSITSFRKEFHEGHLHSSYGGSSFKAPNAEHDPLLSSFMSAVGKESQPSANTKITAGESSERVAKRAPVSEKEREEAALKSEFVRGLLLSTMLGDE